MYFACQIFKGGSVAGFAAHASLIRTTVTMVTVGPPSQGITIVASGGYAPVTAWT